MKAGDLVRTTAHVDDSAWLVEKGTTGTVVRMLSGKWPFPVIVEFPEIGLAPMKASELEEAT